MYELLWQRLTRFFLLGISLRDVLVSTSSALLDADRLCGTYVICGLFILIALLILSSLGFIWGSLLLVQGLPSLAENLANLAFVAHTSQHASRPMLGVSVGSHQR
jgi:hypothetical protein